MSYNHEPQLTTSPNAAHTFLEFFAYPPYSVKIRLVVVPLKSHGRGKASATTADELNLDALEEGCQQQRAKHVFWTTL